MQIGNPSWAGLVPSSSLESVGLSFQTTAQALAAMDGALIDSNQMYTALQTHIVDGQESPVTVIDSYRVNEVQRYLSVTNHQWTGSWFVVNAAAWNGFPRDPQGAIERNVAKAVMLERRDMALGSARGGDRKAGVMP